MSKEGWGEGRWGVGGCHSECITLMSGGIKFVEQSYLTKGFLGVFDMEGEQNGRCVL